MSDLLSLLNLGASAISAQNSGVAVATNNVANMNTPGYSRESVQLDSLIGPPSLSGVVAGSPTRAASELLSGQIRSSQGSLSRSQTTSSALSDLESTLNAGPSITDQLATVFSDIDQVSASPTDKSLRDATVSALGRFVGSINSAASTVASATSSADQQIGDIATQVTSLSNQLAAANKAVATSSDPTAADRRDSLAQQLSQLVGGQAQIGSDGQMRFILDGGAVLVDGQQAATMQATPDSTTGLNDVTVTMGSTSRDVTSQISGGSLGGELAVRGQLTTIAAQYDQYASDVATSFNAVSSANAGLDGVSGRNMFTPPAGVAGAAAALTLDPGLVANSNQLATAAVGAAPGDNTGAQALFALSSQQVASGGTRSLTDAALDIPAGLGTQVANAKADATTDQAVADHLGDLQDSLSGVDQNEEEANLARFQNTTAALTKFVSAVDDMLSSLIQNL